MKPRINQLWPALFFISVLICLSAVSSFADTVTNTYDDTNRVVREYYGQNVPATFTITATAGANGTISPSGIVIVSKNTNKTYTITPSAGYLVQDVLADGISVGAVTTYTFANITTDHEISATFISCTLTGPSNLTAAVASTTQVTLGWTDNSTNETGFKVEGKACAGGTYSQIAIVAQNTITYSSVSLTPDTCYYFRVKAYNACSDSFYSNEASATTLPIAPTNLVAATASMSQVNISWTGNTTNGSGFRIERKTGATGAWSEIVTVGPTIASYQNTGLTADTAYYYRVRTYNVSGNSVYSNETSAMTLPIAPTNLVATAVSTTQINLNWTGSVTNGEFKIQRKIGQTGTWATLPTTDLRITSYQDTGLTQGTMHYYRVWAHNAGGDTSYTEASTMTLALLYIVTPSAGANGIISPSTPQTVNYNGTASFTVSPTAGYYITSISGCGGTAVGVQPINTPYTYTTAAITADCTVTANFGNTYTVTASAGTGGTVEPSGPQVVNYNETASFTVTPTAGYRITSINGCGGTSVGVQAYNASYTYTSGSVTWDCVVTATFEIIPGSEDFETGNLSKLPWVSGGNGYWFVQNIIMHNDTYAAQSPILGNNQMGYLEVTLNITAPESIYFWYKVSSDVTDSLIFSIDGVALDSWSGEAGWAYIGYPVGIGQHTFRWAYSKDAIGTSGSDAAWIDNIAFPPYELVSHTVTTSMGSQGTVAPTGPISVYHGLTTSFTVSPNAGYHIASISGCGGPSVGVQPNNAAYTYATGPIISDCIVTASVEINSYSVTPSPGANGSMTPSTPQLVNHSVTTSFNVSPGAGYYIKSISGCGGTAVGVQPINTPYTYTTAAITADCTVSATFGSTYTVTPSPGSGGSISPSTPQQVNYNTSASFSVSPSTGYYITLVSGCGGTWSSSPYGTGPITGDCTVTASFALIPTYSISGTVTSGGSPLSGVTMTLSGAASGTTATNASGGYTFSGLINGSYTITPNTAGGVFTPAGRSVAITGANVQGQDFTGTVLSVRIAGATPVYFTTLQAAYNAAGTGDIIQAQALTFTENLSVNRNVTVALQGGYDGAFTTNSGNVTNLKGMIQTFSGGGTLTISNFHIVN